MGGHESWWGPRPMTPYDSQFLRDWSWAKYSTTAYFAGATPQNSYMPPQALCAECSARPAPGHRAGLSALFISTPGVRTRRAHQVAARSPPPASGSCGENIPALSAAFASPAPRPLGVNHEPAVDLAGTAGAGHGPDGLSGGDHPHAQAGWALEQKQAIRSSAAARQRHRRSGQWQRLSQVFPGGIAGSTPLRRPTRRAG